MRPEKLIVGFKTRLNPGFVFDDSDIQAPSNYKDPEKIAAYIAKEKQALATELLYQPYSATFDQVYISDCSAGKAGRWSYRDPASGKPSVAVSIRNWLLQRFPKAWPHTTNPQNVNGPAVVIMGFDTRLFLKILGIECSLPANQPLLPDGKRDETKSNALPLSLWYANSDHRDLQNAVMGDYKYLNWPSVLKARGLDERFKNWKGVHVDPAEDVSLGFELATQLGMLTDAVEEL